MIGIIFLAATIVSAIALVSAIFLVKKKPLHPTMLVGFAAGVMLTTAVLELLPEALHESIEPNLLPVFFGVIIFFFLERFVLWFHHHDDTHHTKPTAYLILVGDSIHNFIDGVAIAAAFLVDINVGILTTLAIIAHEVPQELADAAILVSSGMKKSKALLFNFLSGLTSLLGAGVGYVLLSSVEKFLPSLLGFTAGMFLYISLSDLIPELHKSHMETSKLKQTIPFILGCILSLVLIFALHESH